MMTDTDMEDVLRNLDRRVETIEQILPTLATKEDLKAFATKEDLKAFATKEDLKAFATKQDLQKTNGDLQNLRLHMDIRFEHLESKIDTLAEHLADISLRLPPRP